MNSNTSSPTPGSFAHRSADFIPESDVLILSQGDRFLKVHYNPVGRFSSL